jgi:hypothetical protein
MVRRCGTALYGGAFLLKPAPYKSAEKRRPRRAFCWLDDVFRFLKAAKSYPRIFKKGANRFGSSSTCSLNHFALSRQAAALCARSSPGGVAAIACFITFRLMQGIKAKLAIIERTDPQCGNR